MRLIHNGLVLTGVPLILAVVIIGATFALILQADKDRYAEMRHRQIQNLCSESVIASYRVCSDIANFFDRGDLEARHRLKGEIPDMGEIKSRIYAFEPEYRTAFSSEHRVVYLMKEQHGGHIVNISSVAGRVARAGSSGYNASKWAVGAFSEALRQEVSKDRIRVTIIEPGAVITELTDHITHDYAKRGLKMLTQLLASEGLASSTETFVV